MHVSESNEAAAVLRPCGDWSICLGPVSLFRRWIRSREARSYCERRLGLLAACTGSLAAAALEDASIEFHEIRVRVQQYPSVRGNASASSRRILVSIALECEAHASGIETPCEKRIRSDPLYAALTRHAPVVSIEVQAFSSIHIRIC